MKPKSSFLFTTTSFAAAALCCGTAFAQADGAATPSLGEVIVTDTPVSNASVVLPAQQYSGTGLLLRSKSTLGETLSATPGVASTYFGPNASRPAIRGLDGDRVRILNNGGSSADVSALSYDHAVPIDPITVERIELLRGPATLLYGGQTSGVVNLITNRIPREALFDAKGGVAGKLDLGYATGSRERSGAALVETGTDRFGLHVDAYGRKSSDVNAPIELECGRGGLPSLRRRICNSANETYGGAVGGTAFFDRGYVGASVDTYRSTYGTVAEDDVDIRMRQNRYALESGWRIGTRAVESIKVLASHTDYTHTEFEAGDPATTFAKRANDLRVEARHARIGTGFGALSGLYGVHFGNTRFSAIGEEAFAPASRTAEQALFGLEELATSWGKLALSGRIENSRIESFGSAQTPRFEVASRDFHPYSIALGGLWNAAKLTPALQDWQLTANVAHVERAPRDYELYANGPHAATGTYEIGNAGLSKERSNNFEAGTKWQRGANRFALNAYYNRYTSYIAQLATGAQRNPDGSSDAGAGNLPVFVYTQVPARFYGLEAGGNVRLAGGRQVTDALDLELRADSVRATNLQTGEPLPRIAPWRAGSTLVWREGAYGARFGVDYFGRQDRVPAGDVPTAGYALFNASLDWRMKAGPTNLLWYARIDNIGNRLAYSATSILTQTAPGRAPLPGRSLKIGLRASF